MPYTLDDVEDQEQLRRPFTPLPDRIVVDVTVKEAEFATSDEKSKLMGVPTFVIDGPEQYKGWTRRHWFVLGTDEDPNCDNEDTRGPGFTGLKRLLRVTETFTPPMELNEMVGAPIGQRCSLYVGRTTNRKTGKPADQILAFYPLGQYPAGTIMTALDDGAATPAPVAARPATPSAPRAVVNRPVVAAPEEGAPSPTRPVRTVRRSA